jgi:hypothetical protein
MIENKDNNLTITVPTIDHIPELEKAFRQNKSNNK